MAMLCRRGDESLKQSSTSRGWNEGSDLSTALREALGMDEMWERGDKSHTREKGLGDLGIQ